MGMAMTQSSSTSASYTYSIPKLIIPALRVFSGIPSSLSRDAAVLLEGAHPRPVVWNAQNIPRTGPFVLTVNHYDHPGLGAWWGVAAMACAIAERRTAGPRELHFAMAREWWYPSGFGRWVKQPLTRWAFGQVSKAYGIITLPPVLRTDEFRGQGTIGVRHAIKFTRGPDPQLVGLAPEGGTGENLALCEPPEGAGLFLLLLTHDSVPVLPVGIFEAENNVLTVNFGAPYPLQVPRALPRSDRDRAAARNVMIEIGRLLPERMWGLYRANLSANLRESSRK